MDVIAILRAAVCRSLLGFLVILTLLATPAFPVEYQDSQIFISGFNAYQSKNYQGAIDKMSSLLEKYPDSPLRDMALFWLARAHFKAGHNKDAAQYMAQFFREYPDSPLKGTVEPELTKLATAYAKGEPIPTGVIAATEAKKPAQAVAAATATATAAKAAAEKAAAAQLAEEKAAAEKVAMEKAAADQAAMEKTAAEKAAAEKLAAESAAAEKAATEKATSEKAEFERLAREKAEAEKAWERRVAEEKAAAEQASAKKAAVEKRAEERAAAKKATAERRAEERAAVKRAKAERAAARKAAAERVAAEKAAARKVAADEAAAEKAARARERAMAAEVHKAESMAAMQEKAIAGYKTVIDRYPGTQAAVTAAAKLRKMGIVYGAPGPVSATTVAQAAAPAENSQVINLEVAQFADFAFNVAPAGQGYPVGRRFSIPFEIVNRGNGADSFSLESGFPADFAAQFAPEDGTSSQIRVTPRLAPGEKFKGVLTAAIPGNSIDGQKFTFPIKASSQFAHDFSQSRVISLMASAPLLRAVIKPDKSTVLPNGKVTYRIALLNVGSADANNLTLRLSYPPMTEPADATSAGFRQEMKGAIVADGLKISSGESRDFSVTFQVKEDAAAHQSLVLRGDVINGELDTKESFLSTVTTVEGLSGVAAKSGKENLQVIPGQTVTIPVVVTNTGNMRDSYLLRPDVPSGISCRFYQDLKRDDIKQAGAPSVNSTGALEPRENAYLLMELGTQGSAADGSSATIGALFESESDRTKSASVSVALHFARPIVELSMTGQGGKLKPGEVSSFDLNVVNRGSNLAKTVEVQSFLPDNLEMMASDLQAQAGTSGEYIWKFPELGAGEKRSIRVTFRVRSGIPVGTNIQIRNLVTYEDQLGNRY